MLRIYYVYIYVYTHYVYIYIYLSYEYIITNDNNINMLVFTEFIKLLALNEDNILKYNYYNKKKIYNHYKEPYENELFKIENLLFKIQDPIKIGYDNSETKDNIIGWRERYYNYYWNINNNELEDFSKILVEHYLIGLKWVTLYYFDKNPSWDWYFPFDFPPFISDINKYLIDINKITFDIGQPLEPFMQLLTVLPPQANYLLPKSLRKLMLNTKSSLTYLYPNEFEQCISYGE